MSTISPKRVTISDSKTVTLPNLCHKVRVDIDGKAYRVFSVKYKHPSELSEDHWQVFSGTTEHPILIDKDTLAVLEGREVSWLYADRNLDNKEPTIMACELILEKELYTI